MTPRSHHPQFGILLLPLCAHQPQNQKDYSHIMKRQNEANRTRAYASIIFPWEQTQKVLHHSFWFTNFPRIPFFFFFFCLFFSFSLCLSLSCVETAHLLLREVALRPHWWYKCSFQVTFPFVVIPLSPSESFLRVIECEN